ncbi:hypothetical protein [Actinomadura madurae]
MDGRAVSLDEVAERFGVPCWLGTHTRTFWALAAVVAGGAWWRR